MISQLYGKIISKQPPLLIIDTGALSYEVFAPMSTFYHLPDLNEPVRLLTHLIVREDAHSLYGFFDPQERHLFRALIKVNGVGPKLALTILSGMEINTFIECVQKKEVSRLTHIPGIGKKTAERLVIEIGDTLSQWETKTHHQTHAPSDKTDDAINALMSLGYKPQIAKQVINKITDTDLTIEELIKLALKQMNNSNN